MPLKRIECEIGARYGSWTVLRHVANKNRYAYYECVCACGKVEEVRGTRLLSGAAARCRKCGAAARRAAAAITPEAPPKREGRISLAGREFGRLRVLADSGLRTPGRHILWECICVCGTPCTRSTAALKTEHATSCGCLQREGAAERKAADIAGREFGWLTAIRPTERRSAGYVVWETRCRCGNTHFARSNALLFFEVVSCGCAAEHDETVTPPEWAAKKLLRAHRRRAREAGAEGSFTAEDIDRIYKAQRGRCAYCRAKLRREDIRRDHIHSLARGGSNHARNVQVCCTSCNSRKHAKDPIDFAREMGRLL